MRNLAPAHLIAAMCLAHMGGIMTTMTFPALLPTFQREWQLANTEAGWISGVYYAGYVGAVPVLVSLTDRVDPRRILLGAALVTAASAFAFAVFAGGVWSATLWRAVQGIGFAGIYMPGLKALTDRIPDRLQSRAVAFYTSSFGVGSSLSIFLAGEIEAALGWRWAFVLGAFGPLACFAIAAAVLRPMPPAAAERPPTALLDFRPVFANRRAVAYTLAYMVHNAELFALRSWIVAFLVFSQAQQPAGAFGTVLRATVIATAVNLLSMPSSVLANELAQRFGRPPVLLAVMSISAVVAVALGFSGTAPFWIVLALVMVYGVTITADSATITAGTVGAADPRYRGATMAVHSMVGFVGSAAGPVIFGIVLDLAGGESSPFAWGLAFATMGLIVLTGPLFVYTLGRSRS